MNLRVLAAIVLIGALGSAPAMAQVTAQPPADPTAANAAAEQAALRAEALAKVRTYRQGLRDAIGAAIAKGDPAALQAALAQYRQAVTAELLLEAADLQGQARLAFLEGRAREAAEHYVRVRRLSGSAPWIAYAVVNDGGAPGQRSGDGACVAMNVGTLTRPAPASSWAGLVTTSGQRGVSFRIGALPGLRTAAVSLALLCALGLALRLAARRPLPA